MKLLLVQARAPDDPLAAHEQRCIERRLVGFDVALVVQNALRGPAELAWLDQVDALVIGGSGSYSVNHPLSERWVSPLRYLLDGVLRRALPTFGICFGHQLLGLHLGSKVETHAHLEEVGTMPFELTALGAVTEPFAGLGRRFNAHTGHSDHVVGLPPGVDLLVRSAQVELQAFRVRGAPIYTTQFHPDLEGREAKERFLSVKSGPDGRPPDPEVTRKAEAFCVEGKDEAAALLGRFLLGVEAAARADEPAGADKDPREIGRDALNDARSAADPGR